MKIGIIGAMEVEVAYLKDHLADAQVEIVAGMEFTQGTFDGVPVVVVFCSVGKVNAGICVQILIDRFGATQIINTGVAGSLDARINIGDLVVSTDAVHHDMDVANLGYEVGQVPGMDTLAFPTDAALRQLFIDAAHEVAPEIQVFEGRIASGDQFIRTNEEKQRIIRQFDALCTEMEGAAIAHVCYLNQVPCVIARAISDKADGSDAESYDEFEAKAAHRCALITEYAIRRLA